LIVHHARGTGDTILTRVVQAQSITLDPPELKLTVGDIYGESWRYAARRARLCGAVRSVGVPLGMMPVGLSFLIV
jgi:hypothetical protein